MQTINEEGVQYKAGKNARYISIGQSDKINDIEVLEMFTSFEGDTGFSATFDYNRKYNGASVKIDSLKENPLQNLRSLVSFVSKIRKAD